MKLKRILALALSLCMMLALFAGCAPKTDADKPTDGADKPDADAGKRTEIIMAEASDIVTLDPHDSTDTYSNKAITMIYDRLINLDADANVIPGLAESWEEVSPTEIVFHLTKGVKFHNGEELKASDVKFSLDRQRSTPRSAPLLAKVTEVNVVDEYTVQMILSEAYAPIFVNLTETQSSILNEKAVTDGGTKYAQNPVGTGPMKFESWQPNDNAVLVANDDYFGGKPVTTKITLRVIPEPTSRTIALETGEVDFVNGVTAIDINRVKDNADLKVTESPSSNVSYLAMNQSKAPFDNVKVRQALSYATNKESIVTALYEGFAIPSYSPFSTIMPSYDTSLEGKYAFDIEKAKALMIEAGYPDGFSAKIVVSSDNSNRIAQMLQADYGQLNVTLDIMMYEFGAMMDELNKGNHDMFIMGWGHATNPDKTLTNNFHSSMIGTSGNRSWYNNPELDQTLEAARTTTDWPAREVLYKQAQNIIMDDAVWIPLIQTINVIGMGKGVEGIEWYKSGNHLYHNMYVVE